MSDKVQIHTVLGAIEPSALGRTLMHEHVFCDIYRVTGRLNELLNDEALAEDELSALRTVGGTGLVEVERLIWAAIPERCAESHGKRNSTSLWETGWYRQPYYPPEIDRLLTNELADIMITELTDGVEGTGIPRWHNWRDWRRSWTMRQRKKNECSVQPRALKWRPARH